MIEHGIPGLRIVTRKTWPPEESSFLPKVAYTAFQGRNLFQVSMCQVTAWHSMAEGPCVHWTGPGELISRIFPGEGPGMWVHV